MPQSPILVCYGLLELFSERCTVVKNSVYLQIRDEVHSKSLGSTREGAMKENVFSTRLQLKKVVGVLLIFLFTLLEHMQVERVRFSQSAPAPLNCSFFPVIFNWVNQQRSTNIDQVLRKHEKKIVPTWSPQYRTAHCIEASGTATSSTIPNTSND